MQPAEFRDGRKRLGLTQGELAAALALSTPFISMMERGEKPIERRTALALLYLLDHPEAMTAE